MTGPDRPSSDVWLDLPPPSEWCPSERARRVYAGVELLSRVFHVEFEGLERLPAGRALVVANHTFGWDVLFVMARVFREHGRPLWALGEHAFWKFPGLRTLARDVFTVDGSQRNIDELLRRDQAVIVMPGGLREAVKPRELRYRLLWGQRYGFVRAAIRHGAPIVPMAALGADDLFDFVGDAYARGARWFGRPDIPVPLPARILPLPRRVQMRFILGEPLPPPVPPEAAGDELALRRYRHEVAGAVHELIDIALARRAGVAVR